ncbi:hypothetical protein [Sphingobium lignivorans]|uniref:Uncharacterized protein n=1 Tax=Sphingobium lignivorans TaxID=2735886 RepID=A0ABR6NJE7_9SPHN|nr:hypothetical protein [Sphingobium lignivorans]MBB5987405.1 hypothetical protein [Sphingobium lignivorans]
MAKAKPHPGQIAFAFDPPAAPVGPAALAGLERRISGATATILNSDPRSREVIAAEMSVLLDEEISRAMLDAYASPAREGHKVIMSRFLALVAVCERHDLLDQVLREIGAAVLVGEELHTARLGHLDRQIAKLKIERQRLAGTAPLIRGKKHGHGTH